MFASLVIASFFITFVYSFKYFMQRLLVIEAGKICPHQPNPANE